MHNPKVSVIILNYNGLRFIEQCLKSVLKTDYANFEVILVDNASQDGSLELAKKLFEDNSKLMIVKNKNNLGFAQGNNIGAKYAKGDILVFLNIDTEVEPNWLKELVNVMSSDSIIGAAQCKLLIAQNRSKLESVGHYVDYVGVESYWSANVHGQVDKGQYNRVREIFYAKGAAIAVKKDLFLQVGAYDSSYFIDHDEIDLCWRILLRGFKIVFVPNSVVYHFGGHIMGKRKSRQALFHLRKNHLASLIKNYTGSNLFKYIPVYLTYIVIHAGYCTFKRENDVISAYLKAVLWIIRNFNYVYAQKQLVQHIVRNVPDKEVMKYMVKPRIPLYLLR